MYKYAKQPQNPITVFLITMLSNNYFPRWKYKCLILFFLENWQYDHFLVMAENLKACVFHFTIEIKTYLEAIKFTYNQ